MKRLIIAAIVIISMSVLSACAENGSSEEKTTRVIAAGSTSVHPYVEILVEEYRFLYPNHIVGIQGGGSSAGIRAVRNEIAEIGMLSRSLTEEEQDLWSVEIALDGLAIIIHPDNPVDNLSIQQVRDIYTRSITNWSEVGGHDARIHIIAREEGSGTRGAFQELVMADEFISQRAVVQNSNGAIRQLVSGNRDTIGFISLGLAEPQPGMSDVKALSLGGVAPTQKNVLSGEYELFRAFLFVSAKEPEPGSPTRHFIDFVLSDEGQEILMAEGLISIRGRVNDEED
ncbi:MAG: phosphate ABC transporter substrate-binding protein [Oscillospiraceae bacterium]|jgi:phosphate transport system substrate-binding protein|nr:phosphate ABC transporter substrate-binding protein [Oscillospiraceae bacterium]